MTTYGYDPVGRLILVDYGDNTPDVTYTYHRDGSRASATDAAGTHTYSPRPLGATVVEETLVWDAGYGAKAAKIVNNLDGQGRRTEWKLQTGADLATLTTMSQVNYSYTSGGDLASVTGAGMIWSYSYLAGTSLIDRVTASGTGVKTITLQKSYDSRRRVSNLAYTTDNLVRLGWAYDYDAQHPERRVKTASLVNGLPGWAYDYNVRGEVTGASRGTGGLGSQSTVEGQTWGYAYDAIGNRVASTRGLAGDTTTGGQRTTTYEANALNQYTNIARPNALEVTGVTNATVPRVSVNGQPPTGRPPSNGEPGGFALWLNSVAGGSSDGQWPQVNLNVEHPGAGPNGTDLSYYRGGRTLVRPSAQPAYDEDGNLVNDGTWYYQWDGENRLVLALMKPDNAPLDVPLQMISYRYDAQGRRVSKAIYEKRTPSEPNSTRPTEWSPVEVVLFYYDGWNLMAEVSGAHPETSSRRYIWGTDLSGTLQGAGGVGGLLGIARATGKVMHLPCTEVNGNVMGLIGAVSGELLTRWDYDAFGNVVTDWVKPGSSPAKSPFKFSTKYEDEETGLVYYGLRYYDPVNGQWMSRDPIGEEGGLNLPQFVGNDSINHWDYLGLADPVGHHIVAQEYFKYFSKEVASYFDSISGRLAHPNYNWHSNHEPLNGTTHREYSDAVKKELDSWCKGKGLTPKSMKVVDAQAFIQHLDQVPSGPIRRFNDGVKAAIEEARLLGPRLIRPNTPKIPVGKSGGIGKRIPVIRIFFVGLAFSSGAVAAATSGYSESGCAVIGVLSAISPVGYDDIAPVVDWDNHPLGLPTRPPGIQTEPQFRMPDPSAKPPQQPEQSAASNFGRGEIKKEEFKIINK